MMMALMRDPLGQEIFVNAAQVRYVSSYLGQSIIHFDAGLSVNIGMSPPQVAQALTAAMAQGR